MFLTYSTFSIKPYQIMSSTSIFVVNTFAEEFNSRLHSKESELYKIIHYDTQMVCFDDQETGKYRSVVCSKNEQQNCQLVSFSPPKSIPMSLFTQRNPTKNGIIPPNVIITEIVEGTMIQLFYNSSLESWEIATKNAIGCDYWYYRNFYDEKSIQQITFRQMFMEAIGEFYDSDLNESRLVRDLDKDYCYNFVLQHPQNHIVLMIEHACVYLVAIYKIVNLLQKNEFLVNQLPLMETVKETFVLNLLHELGIFLLPEQHPFSQNTEPAMYNNILHYRNYEIINSSKDIMIASPLGYMFLDTNTGDRAKIECEYYGRLKELRGNNPNLQYQYLCVRRMNKVKDFLYYFPQYRGLFYRFYQDFENFINNVHMSYLSYYIQKQEIVISKKYAPHVFKIHHEVYLPSLQTEEPIIVKRRVVKEYFEKMEPRELIYHLNYDRRIYMKSFLNESKK